VRPSRFAGVVVLLGACFVSRGALADCSEGENCCLMGEALVVGVARYPGAGLDGGAGYGGALLAVERLSEQHSPEWNGAVGDVVRLPLDSPEAGSRIVAVLVSSSRSVVPESGVADGRLVFRQARVLDGRSRTCGIGDRQLTLTESEAIDLTFRSDCHQEVKARLGFERDEGLCDGQDLRAGACTAGAPGYRPGLASVVCVVIFASVAARRARRRLTRR